MSAKKEGRPLKVCQTCQYWSTRHKGLCSHLNQGVGRFWICEAWRLAETETAPRPDK